MAPLQLVFFACAAYIQAVVCFSSHHSGKQPGSNTCGIYSSKTRRWCKVGKSDFPGAIVTLQGIMKKSKHEDEMPAKLLKAYFSLYLDNSGWFLRAKWISFSKKEVSAKVSFPKHGKPKILKLKIERDDNQPQGYHLPSKIPLKPDNVVELTDSNFDELVFNSDKSWLVTFCSPYCGYCKRFMPEFAEVSHLLAYSTEKVKFGSLDITQHKVKKAEHEITHTPTIKYFPPGSKSPSDAEEYTSSRKRQNLVAFVLNKLGNSTAKS